jgi:hypothetical protein
MPWVLDCLSFNNHYHTLFESQLRKSKKILGDKLQRRPIKEARGQKGLTGQKSNQAGRKSMLRLAKRIHKPFVNVVTTRL